jgi:hypothetical protein
VSTFEYGVNIFGGKFITYFPEGRDFYQPNGYFPNVGEVFVPRGLAATLQAVAWPLPEAASSMTGAGGGRRSLLGVWPGQFWRSCCGLPSQNPCELL